MMEVACDSTQRDVTSKTSLLSFQNPRVVDTLSGNPVNTINVHQLVQIVADVKNLQSPEQSFAYAVQISGSNGIINDQWIRGSLSTGSSFSPSLIWEPKSCGNFTVNLFLYDDITNKNLLATPLSLALTVGGCTSDSSNQNKDYQRVTNNDLDGSGRDMYSMIRPKYVVQKSFKEADKILVIT
ncbi:hypothetical protein [Candidatus Nitrosotenuis uzonensis]|uniref:Uncharacterized protein n=1 Tax=Candidatus Nitrosotenuis uzonensis TaxID=1407055 RepID=V6AV79_9ARCH|nr:hypothetical protein [Candidatus Nitrosotenuis uzonensis]CDI06462.1 hypothetical protein NITUZ_50009 [Candidatus Nitrosotenuis uzonensis]